MADHRCDRDVRWELLDARGMFCGFVCPICEETKKSKFRPEIFTDPNYETTEDIDPD